MMKEIVEGVMADGAVPLYGLKGRNGVGAYGTERYNN